MKKSIEFINSFQFESTKLTVSIEIGEIFIQLSTDNEIIAEFVKNRYRQFLSISNFPDYRIEIFLAPALYFKSPDPNENFFNKQKFSEDTNLIYSNGYTGYLNKKIKAGKVIVNDDIPETWVEHFLRFAFSWMALEDDCLFFHGAGIINNNSGYVFFGPSNAGKTTVTEFSANYSILGDDMVMLRKSNGKFHVYATPFNINMGDIKLTNTNKRIKGFYRLRQDRSNYLKRMKNSKAVAELMSCVPLSNNNFNGNLKAFSVCSEIVDKVPCYDLHFTRDDSFWRLINEHG